MNPVFQRILDHPDTRIRAIAASVKDEIRISAEDAMYLYEKADLALTGVLANHIRERKNGQYTFFNRNFHIEPTNVCVFSCKFCSYSMEYKNKEAGWELDIQQMLDKVKAYDGKEVTEVHIVGGVHPKMDVEFFV
jgi:aminodeoxyfutalosine synthase